MRNVYNAPYNPFTNGLNGPDRLYRLNGLAHWLAPYIRFVANVVNMEANKF